MQDPVKIFLDLVAQLAPDKQLGPIPIDWAAGEGETQLFDQDADVLNARNFNQQGDDEDDDQADRPGVPD